jgi:hypothetical protein
MLLKEAKCDKFRNCIRRKKRSIRKRSHMLLIGISIHPWAKKLVEMLRWWMPDLDQILGTLRLSLRRRAVKA